jgi:hypothetical protein
VNIFYVNTNAELAAQSMVDRHVVKMILETAQLLSTAHRVLDGEEFVGQSQSGRKAKRWRLKNDLDDIMYSATHINHPSAVWTRQSVANYNWLVDHLVALGYEYTHRYGRTHITIDKLADILKNPPQNIPHDVMTPMPSCMAKEYIVSDDPVENYRNYYNKGKTSLHRWTNRFPPDWIDGEIQLVLGSKHIYIARNMHV